MQKVLALVLVVVSFVHARDEPVMPSYWELLEIVNEEYSLLLGHVGGMKYTLWLQDEYPDSFFQNICNSTGYSVAHANEVFGYIPYESLPCIYSEGTDEFYFCDAPVFDEYIVALKCFGEEGGTEEQGLELEFGGAKLNLNLNKIRTKWNF